MNEIKNKKRVLIGISGGVDSSVAAALLKKQGYDVVGVFLKFWSPEENVCRENACCNYEALQSARKVCEILDIPFHVFDVKDEFKKEVVDYFVSEYEQGRTPNPCVVCNKKIKFGWLLDKARKLGCNYLATGHYAKNKKIGKINYLLTAKDKKKDQTYFLWQLDQKQLEHIVFPLGDYTKDEVRNLAKKFKLPTYSKQESQDICFIDNGLKEFFKNYATKLKTSGEIVDTKGNIVGSHEGLIYYTLGQRENLPKIDYKKLANTFDKHRIPALYVIKLDVNKNRLVVGEKEQLYTKKLSVRNINWVRENESDGFEAQAKIRYQGSLGKCQVRLKDQKAKVIFDEPQRAITLGQSVVFYDHDKLVGGGIIE